MAIYLGLVFGPWALIIAIIVFCTVRRSEDVIVDSKPATPPIGWAQFCKDYPGQIGPTEQLTRISWDEATVARIREVNHRIAYDATASASWRWTIHSDGVAEGNCAEYAASKRAMLREFLPHRAVRFATWLVGSQAHLTVALITNRGIFFLSNGYDEPLTVEDCKLLGWIPIAMESGEPGIIDWIPFQLPRDDRSILRGGR